MSLILANFQEFTFVDRQSFRFCHIRLGRLWFLQKYFVFIVIFHDVGGAYQIWSIINCEWIKLFFSYSKWLKGLFQNPVHSLAIMTAVQLLYDKGHNLQLSCDAKLNI